MAIQILEQIPLAPLTTMRVGGNARYFVKVKNTEELEEAVRFANAHKLPIFVLGGGSNTLFSDEGFFGIVIKIEMKGIYYEGDVVRAMAGERWDDVVSDVVTHGLWGIENLSLVPGTAGGAAVQNIGAYGVEACDTIYSVDALDVSTMQLKTFLRNECEFGYRESIFKKNNNLIVISVTFALSHDAVPNIGYEDVKKYFEQKNIQHAKKNADHDAPSLSEIRDAIISIRTAKMPAPPLGTAGSFFKNPVVNAAEANRLKNDFPEIKTYLQGDGSVKLSAAWLFDHIGGWRGVRRGDVGVHERQALILVNYGRATAHEIMSLANEMKKDIKQKTNVDIEEEVVMIGDRHE